jgi:hypothetical protein
MKMKLKIGIFVQALVSILILGCASTPGRDKALDPVMASVVSPDNSLLAVTTDSQEVALFSVLPLRFHSLLTPKVKK